MPDTCLYIMGDFVKIIRTEHLFNTLLNEAKIYNRLSDYASECFNLLHIYSIGQPVRIPNNSTAGTH